MNEFITGIVVGLAISLIIIFITSISQPNDSSDKDTEISDLQYDCSTMESRIVALKQLQIARQKSKDQVLIDIKNELDEMEYKLENHKY